MHSRKAFFGGAQAKAITRELMHRLMAQPLLESHGVQQELAGNEASLQRMADALHNDTLFMQQAMLAATERILHLENELALARSLCCEDQLTGCLNRRGAEQAYAREAARAARSSSCLSLALLDLDNFKRLNDEHGHAFGDEALVHLAHVARQSLRGADILARWGGEEFVLLLPDTPLSCAAQAVARVQRALRLRPLHARRARVTLNFSAGVCLAQSHESCQQLLQRADAALYEAKRLGKDRIVAG